MKNINLDPQEEAIRGAYNPENLYNNVYGQPLDEEVETKDRIFFTNAMISLLGLAGLLAVLMIFQQ